MNDLTTTNVWLAVLAIVSLIEFLVIRTAAVLGYKMYRQAMTVLETVERVHIVPIRVRVEALLDEVEGITDKVKHAQESVDHVFQAASGAGSMIAGAVMAKSWPMFGIINGVRIAAKAILKNGKTENPRIVGSASSREQHRPSEV